MAFFNLDGILGNIFTIGKKSNNYVSITNNQGNAEFNNSVILNKELIVKQITTPTSPQSGFNKLYTKGDDKLYLLNKNGGETSFVTETTISTITGEIRIWSMVIPPVGWIFCNGAVLSRTIYNDLFNVITLNKGIIVIDIEKSLFTLENHGLVTTDCIELTTTIGLPTPLQTFKNYYIIKKDENSFWLALSIASAQNNIIIELSGIQSGIHNLRFTPYETSGAYDFLAPVLIFDSTQTIEPATLDSAGYFDSNEGYEFSLNLDANITIPSNRCLNYIIKT